ncbi:DUF4326 domain-containing protein [Microbacterium sp.]|uniref:DUF4326 domain-containing protein n=1 Tax=Microbacterium sp. TaxID=51671 RepID=UPI003F7060DD
MPGRIQMTRNRPWRAENPDAVRVDRATIWGNPFHVGEEIQVTTLDHEIAMIRTTPAIAVACYRDLMATRTSPAAPDDHPDDVAAVQRWHDAIASLRGKDLACWCALDQPCHADVLLELANGGA